MGRTIAATFFVLYVLLMGLWPTSRWWSPHTKFVTWTMYSLGSGKPGRDVTISLDFPDGRTVILPTASDRPFTYVYRPGALPPSKEDPGEGALFRFAARPEVVLPLGDRICAEFPDAESVSVKLEGRDAVRCACP